MAGTTTPYQDYQSCQAESVRKQNAMKRLYFQFFVCSIMIILNGCMPDNLSSNPVKQKIINHCRFKDECIFDLQKITPFAWDTMYQFDGCVPTDLESILLPLGFDTIAYCDYSVTVFVYKGRLVHYELYNATISEPGVGSMQFYERPIYERGKSYSKFSSSDATFSFEKRSLGFFSKYYDCQLIEKENHVQ
jgi:hypothetical protein